MSDAEDPKKEPLVGGAKAGGWWKMTPDGWTWATGSKYFQKLTAAICLLFFIIALCSFVCLAAGFRGKMPNPQWAMKTNDNDEAQNGIRMMPVLHLDMTENTMVKPDPDQKCLWCQCNWGGLDGAICYNTIGKNPPSSYNKTWCDSSYVEKNVGKNPKEFLVFGLALLVLSVLSCVLFALQLTGKRPFLPAVTTDGGAALESRGAYLRHWIGPVIDRVVATIGTFLVCFIAACDATGKSGFEPVKFTRQHKGCYTNNYASDCDKGALCNDVTYHHDFENALTEWESWGTGRIPTARNAMWFAVFCSLMIGVLGVLLHFRVQNPTDKTVNEVVTKEAEETL